MHIQLATIQCKLDYTANYNACFVYNFQIENCNIAIMHNKIEPDEQDDGVITKGFLKKLIKSNFKLYYSTPELNDILHLHYKGFKKIDNLEPYKGLKVLYLEGNCIKKIENLQKLTNIRSLYLQENLIETIEGLDQLTQISNLNLSDNMIERIQGLKNLTRLSNLLLKNNRIGLNGLRDLTGLLQCQSVSCLDIQNNRISVPEFVDEVLAKMENIAVVYLQKNEFNKQISHYRKTLINKISSLQYIDDKPIFQDEKRYAQAFARGGLAEQRKQRQLYKKQQQQAHLRQHHQFRDMLNRFQQQGRRERQQRQARGDRDSVSQNQSYIQTNSKDQSLQTYKSPEQMSEKTPDNQSQQSKSNTHPESVRQSQSQRNSQREPSEKGQQLKQPSVGVNDAYLDQLD